MQAKEWKLTVFLDEVDDDRTTARAVLETPAGRTLTGEGHARRNPGDRPVPEIGDELAAGRALSHLAHQLIEIAADDVSASVAALE